MAGIAGSEVDRAVAPVQQPGVIRHERPVAQRDYGDVSRMQVTQRLQQPSGGLRGSSSKPPVTTK